MQSSAHVWLAERCALKGPGSLMFRYRLSAKPALCCTLPVKVLGFSRLLRELSSPLQLQALPYACQPAASTALLTRPPPSAKPLSPSYLLFTVKAFLNKEGKK